MSDPERPDPQRRLELLLGDYERPEPGAPPRPQSGYLRSAIESSPDLQRHLLQAIDEGVIIRLAKEGYPGALASYSPLERTMSVPYPDHGHPLELVAVAGHETRHALDGHGRSELVDTFLPAIEAIARSPGPHDYTAPLLALVESRRTGEARAEIGGFNAVVSAMQRMDITPDPANIARMMPEQAQSFVAPVPGQPGQFAWRGVTPDADGRLAFTPANVEALKANYVDALPGTFGPNGLLDYRHNAVFDGLRFIHQAEQHQILRQGPSVGPPPLALADGQHSAGGPVATIPVPPPEPRPADAPERARYHVDFAALGVNPALLAFPANGRIGVRDPTGYPLTRFEEDYPGFVVPRAEALRSLGLPPEPKPDHARWVDPPGGERVTPLPAPDLSHPLLRHAADGLERMGPVAGLDGPARHADATAAVALAAARQRIGQIDHVVPSLDGGGLIFIQGRDPAAPWANRGRLDIADIGPAAQSLERLDALAQSQSQSQSQSQAPGLAMAQGTPAPEMQGPVIGARTR